MLLIYKKHGFICKKEKKSATASYWAWSQSAINILD